MNYNLINAPTRFFIFWAFWLLAGTASLLAQEQLGMRLERRAGIYGAALNPSFSAYNPQRWDISLGSGSVYADNSYLFLRDAGAGELLRNAGDLVVLLDDVNDWTKAGEVVRMGFYDGKPNIYGVADARIGGPGFSVRLHKNHTVGLVTGFRIQTSAYNVPEVLNHNNATTGAPLNIGPFQAAAMAWGEIGAHYSYTNAGAGDYIFAFGATPRLLLGQQAMAARNNQPLTHDWSPDGSVAITGLDGRYGFTNNWLHALEANDSLSTRNNSYLISRLAAGTGLEANDSLPLRTNGRSLGIDLGFSIAKSLDGGDADDYKWRIGVSLLDVGRIRFARDRGEVHQLNLSGTQVVKVDDFDDIENGRSFVRQLSRSFGGDPDGSLVADEAFAVGLPAALSVQIDYRVMPLVYVAGVWVQRIPMGYFTLKRPNMLAIAPRFEWQWASLTVPVVVDDWRKTRVGLAARLEVV
jgi:Family of unknown function (DUF5723)